MATGAISITRTRGTSRSGEAQKARIPARVMAISVANPDKIRMTSNPHAAVRTVPPLWLMPGWIERGAQERELGDEAGERRQPGDHQRASDKGKPEHCPWWPGWRCRPRPLRRSPSSAVAISLSRDSEHVRARLATAFDEFDEQKEGADAQGRADQVKERSARDADLPHAGRGKHRS